MNQKFYITTPIYYTNQKPHIGTAYTTIAADVLARYYRLIEDEVFFLTGTDEHGEKIAQAAENAGKKPQEFVDEIADAFKQTWRKLNISYDKFIRTTSDEHKEGAGEFISQLKESGHIYQDEYRGLYCSGCEDFITKKELTEDGKCPYHGKKPELISEANYFFDLKKFLPEIKQKIEQDEIKIEPKERKTEALSLLNQDLGNFSVSRQKVKWGIPLPFDEDQNLYVWVDALTNYVTALGYGESSKNFEKFWPADVHLLAKDILKFHAVFWPALLMAAGISLPKKLFVHGFFTVEGKKMSKSVGNVLDPVEIAEKYGTDTLRYFILREIPFGHDGDFSVSRLEERYTSDLANGLGNLVARTLTLAEKAGIKSTDFGIKNESLSDKLGEVKNKYDKALIDLAFHEALEATWELISFCDEFLETNKPWETLKTNKEKANPILLDLLSALNAVSQLIQPFMPETSDKIDNQLKQIKKTEILFPRLNN
jgi:methionyl-tRNA synthetase